MLLTYAESSMSECHEFQLGLAEKENLRSTLLDSHPDSPTRLNIGKIQSHKCGDRKMFYVSLKPHFMHGKEKRDYLSACSYAQEALRCEWLERLFLIRGDSKGDIELSQIGIADADAVVDYLLTLDPQTRLATGESIANSIHRATHIFGGSEGRRNLQVVIDGDQCQSWHIRVHDRLTLQKQPRFRYAGFGQTIC